MDIFLRYGSYFSVPNAVADNLLKLASHDQLKILLYVLCHAEQPIDLQQITAACAVSSDAVEEALIFWENVNILQHTPPAPQIMLTDSPLTALPVVPVQAVPSPESVQPDTESTVNNLQYDSSSFALMPSEIAERIANSTALSEMFRSIEQICGRPLNNTEQKSFIWMHEYLGLSPDLLMMLAAFCKETDCYQVRYMEKIALEWHERGVLTHELVEADIQRRMLNKSYTGQIMKCFEMTRKPTERQSVYINAWAEGRPYFKKPDEAAAQQPLPQWLADGIPFDLIQLAYEKTRNKKDDKLDFSYLNAILKRWELAGVLTVSAAEAEDAAFYEKKQHTKKTSPSPKRHNRHPEDENASFDLDDFDLLANRF